MQSLRDWPKLHAKMWVMLSPKGEGAMPSVSADTCTPRFIAQPMLLPLPKGEGWGEGKETPGLERGPGIFHGAP